MRYIVGLLIVCVIVLALTDPDLSAPERLILAFVIFFLFGNELVSLPPGGPPGMCVVPVKSVRKQISPLPMKTLGTVTTEAEIVHGDEPLLATSESSD